MGALRIIFRWLVTPLFTLVLGRACLPVAHHFGWYPEVWLAQLISKFPTQFENELAVWILAAFVAVLLWALADYFLYRRKAHSEVDSSPPNPRGLDSTQRQKLCNALKPLATEHTRVKLVYFPPKFRPMLEDLSHVFASAGWTTKTTFVPQERPNSHRYVSGVEVKGRNKHLVEAICKALRDVGVLDARAEILEVANDTPFRQHFVSITIGHIDHGLT